ncbi:Ubiquinol-cytochrome C reductase, cytochrome C1 subunit [Azospirillum argentinense]|uniref:Cytochrome c1 n=2 Tax=Azospirillum TaxID=191 RepID=A0A5B0KMP5_9PROT|nr:MULTISPECIES: cytochrome c1 [Azospirillum]AIB13965.1 cytochrome C [Azospirillum argentinense]EZQ05766.1 cytochrome C [Azospirillum argentinense]KAA1053093.1 Ubiquinol-cytochrome C reductase, cytochrome C1 subunit [Azospirillum argentinense]MBK3803118.1 cytochrome c1 [Azospirillum argentinense]QCO17155.1 cytochrome c1 [Azospirillum brasilense]
MRSLKSAILSAAVALGLAGAAQASEAVHIPKQEWSHSGVFGTIDKASAQRGFQIYKEVCSTCHSAKLVPIRTLAGIGFSEDELKAIAAGYEVQAGPNDAGEMFMRPGIPADRFPSPFPNDNAARAANNGALPPDLSLMAKARVGGEDYLYAFLTGFEENPPEGVTLMPGMNYNKYFPGHQVGMPNILMPDGVTYADGTPATVQQQAHDISTFLTFIAEPHMDARKQMGVKVILFLIVLAGLMYATKRKLWSTLH